MSAEAVTDPAWLAAALAATTSRFRLTGTATAGVLWWYSASSVLLGPVAESYVRGGRAADPALASMTLFLHQDGRVLDARSSSTVDPAEAPARTAAAVATCVDAVAAASAASTRALWAIATDSLANRVLWAGGTDAHAVALAADDRFPVPRYVTVGGQRAVRRASCCLVYEAPGQQKCVSCPRQTPDDRLRRLRQALGR
ncbi:(2Fe-2S)-binding protein [Actinophytocola sp. KF-1]